MNRRSILSSLLVMLAGCSTASETPAGAGENSNHDGEPEVRTTDTAHVSAKQRLNFGEWTENNYVAYRVTGVRFSEEPVCSGPDIESDSYSPKGDSKVAVGEIEIKNIQQEEHRNMLFRSFAFVTPNSVVPSQESFESENSVEIPFANCEITGRYDSRVTFPAYDPMKPGEKRSLYFASVLPKTLSNNDVSVAQKAASGNTYERLWS